MDLQRVRCYFLYLSRLEPRSLACFRIIIALVVLYDVALAWPSLDVWLGMQGLYEGMPLPSLFKIGSDEQILKAIFAGYALLAAGLLVGYKTRWCTLLVWIVSCGHQYAAHSTIDYHAGVVVNLLFWCQALDLGRAWSVDARCRRADREDGDLMARLGACGLVCTFAYIYLATAVEKSDPAWWSEGTAIWLALKDFVLSSALGTWAVSHLPFVLFYHLAHLVVAVEYIAPLLLLCPWWRARLAGCLLLVGLHAGIWLFMELDSFPATMLAGIAAFLPAPFWQRLQATRAARRLAQWHAGSERAMRPAGGDLSGRPRVHRPLQWALGALFGIGLLINVEGHRLIGLEEVPYAGAQWVERLKYILGLEVEWTMFAPTPPTYSGWWVAVGRTADGREIDAITGRAPTLDKPRRGVFPLEGLGASYWFALPVETGVPEYTYTRFLLWRDGRENPPEQRLTHLLLLFVYESYLPIQNADHAAVPVLVLRWPDGPEVERPQLVEGSFLRGLKIYEIDYENMGEVSWAPKALPQLHTY